MEPLKLVLCDSQSLWFKWMSTSTCRQCRKGQAENPETLCGGCLALTSTLGILRGNWWSRSHRKLAEEVLIQASRQVRAVHSLDTGLQSFSDSCEARLRKVVAGQQRPPEPRLPPPRRSVPVLREAPTRPEVPPEEETTRQEEAEPSTGARGRSPSCAPDYGSPSGSSLSSPRVARAASVKEEQPAGEVAPSHPGVGEVDRRRRSRSRGQKAHRKRPHHRGGVKHHKHSKPHHHSGADRYYQRAPESHTPRGKSAREVLDSDI